MTQSIRLPRLRTTLTLVISGLLSFSSPSFSDAPLLVDEQPRNNLLRVAAPLFPTITEENSKGLFFDIFREVFEADGYSISTMILPIRRNIRLLQQGEIDVYLTDWEHSYLTVEAGYRPEKLHTPAQHISKELISAIYLSTDSIEPPDKNTLAELVSNKQQLIGWVKGYEYDSLFDLPPESFQTVSSSKQGLTMLLAGRLKVFLDDRDNSIVIIEQSDFESESFDIVPLRDTPLYPVFQNSEKGLRLAQLYDSRMIELHRSGRIKQLYQKWGYDYDIYFPSFTSKE